MIRKLSAVVLLWLLLAGWVWLTMYRGTPSSIGEWLLLLAIGPLTFLVASLIGEGAFAVYARLPGIRHLHEFAERRGDGRALSWLRLGIYLMTIIAFVCVIVAAAWLIRTI